MAVAHESIPEAYLHEPKGASLLTAGSSDKNKMYLSTGAGVGTWQRAVTRGGLYYNNIGTGITISTPSTYTLIAPATTVTDLVEFTHNSLGRLTYTGSYARHSHMVCDVSFKHSTGSGQDVFFSLHKNGVAIPSSEVVSSADSANYQHISFHADITATTNDYYEVFTKVSSGSVVVHSLYLFVMGMPE